MFVEPPFHDRHDAGTQLTQAFLQELAEGRIAPAAKRFGPFGAGVSCHDWVPSECVVYGLPRGGVVVAEPLAHALQCPLDVVMAKKITLPTHPEVAIGAITADGQVMRSRHIWPALHPGEWQRARQAALQRAQQQWQQLSEVIPHISPTGRVVVLVDDGIATGMTMALAARALWAKRPAVLVICAPVAPPHMETRFRQWCDRTILLHTPPEFSSVSRFYETFPQVEMETVIACLQQHQRRLT